MSFVIGGMVETSIKSIDLGWGLVYPMDFEKIVEILVDYKNDITQNKTKKKVSAPMRSTTHITNSRD